jgi:Fucose 4-O-acetylase and related acetyltransferases
MESSSIVKKRDTTFDSIKFVVIALVVLGHTFQLDMDSGINSNLFSFGLSFRMPAFIIMSGYFYRDSDSLKFWRTIIELLLVILIFQIIYFSRGWLDPFDFSIEGLWYRVSHFYTPIRALWYILSLCLWRMMMRYFPQRMRENYKISIPVALVISLLAGFIQLGREFFVLQKTLVFFPYFLLGYFIHKYNLWARIRSLNKWMCGTIIIVYFILIMLIPNFPDSMCTEHLNYFYGLADWKIMFALRVISYLWMLPLTICVINVIPDCKFFAEQGKNTMFYYLYHPYFIWLMNWCVVNYHAPTSTIYLFIYTIISMYIMYWLCKIPLLNYLTKPITTLRNRK